MFFLLVFQESEILSRWNVHRQYGYDESELDYKPLLKL